MTTSTTSAITARSLTYQYPSRSGVHQVDLDVDGGSLVAVTGSSGSGKSTLLALLGLILRPDRGAYLVDGVDVTALPASARDRFRRDRIGMVLQDLGLLPFLSVWENVAAAFGPHFRAHREQAQEQLAAVGLGHLANRRPGDLSGGERQRVAVARALVKRPSVLLADEPTGNLDAKNTRAVHSLLRRAAEHGAAIVVVTHDDALAQLCDRQLNLRNGSPEPAERGNWTLREKDVV